LPSIKIGAAVSGEKATADSAFRFVCCHCESFRRQLSELLVRDVPGLGDHQIARRVSHGMKARSDGPIE